jgi:hypothetical protein
MTRAERARHATLHAAARRIGCSVADYVAHADAGESWCSYHRAWHPGAEFGSNMARPTGAQPYCLVAMVAIRRERKSRSAA